MRVSFGFLALAAALAIAPALANAQTTDFTYVYSIPSSSIYATGALDGTEVGNTGVYDITSGTININYNDGEGVLTGSLDTKPSDLAPYGADNTLYTLSNSPNGLLLDVGGLLFQLTGGNSGWPLVNLWGGDNNGNVNPNTLANYSVTQQDWVDYPGTFTITAPEGGAGFMYLLLAGAVCFGAMKLHRKALVQA